MMVLEIARIQTTDSLCEMPKPTTLVPDSRYRSPLTGHPPQAEPGIYSAYR